jgi:hypothetical protein
MAFLDIFVGVPQSKYAATAIFAAIFVVSLGILFGREEIPIGQKFALVLILFVMSLPGILITLFQLTCMVTGTSNGRTPWCGWYAWLASALMIVYCVLLIAIAVVAMATGRNVIKELELETMDNFKESMTNANTIANQFFANGAPENFENEQETETFEEDEKKEGFEEQVVGAEGFEEMPTVDAFNNQEGFYADATEKVDDAFVGNQQTAKGAVSLPAPAKQQAPLVERFADNEEGFENEEFDDNEGFMGFPTKGGLGGFPL